MADITLSVLTNTGATVHFQDIAQVARFAELNAQRVSNTLEALLECTADESQKQYALELLTDIAFQVAGAAELLNDDVATRAMATEATRA